MWDADRQALFWTDIAARRVHRLDADGAVTTVALPDRAAFAFPRATGGFVVGFAWGIAIADAAFSRFERVIKIEPELPQTRVNDATIDRQGNLVFGTYDEVRREPVGALYQLSAAGSLTRLLDGVRCANGLAVSPAGDRLHFTDTRLGVIRRFRYPPRGDSLDELEPLAGPDVAPGVPDGATIDAEGGYWSARLRGSCVVRLDPAGRCTDRIELPVPGPTCVALGGPDLKRLHITTLRIGLSPDALAAAPLSGNLFATEVEIAGLPTPCCQL